MSDRRQAIHDAFLRDLRTVILIDDQFPSYDEACAGNASVRSETKRAVALGSGFRGLGLNCEIANDAVPAVEHVRKGDLIVLDYHLTGDHDDGSKARQLLGDLLEDNRQHLVVVYTSDSSPRSIWLAIMASLVGNAEETPAVFEDAEEDVFSEWKRESKYEVPQMPLVQFLRRDSNWINACMKEFQNYKGDKGQLRRFLPRLAHAQVQAHGGGYRPTVRRLETSGKDSTWIRCDNLFVVIVRKGDEESTSGDVNAATFLRDRLWDALGEWNPSFLRVMLNYARHRIVEQGFIGDDRVLRDPTSEAGWLMFMESGTPEERRERVTALYGRLFEDLVSKALDQIETFSASHADHFGGQQTIAPVATPEDVESAKRRLNEMRRRAGVDDSDVPNKKIRDEDILHSLNDYLAFEQHTPAFLRTGTVFGKVSLEGHLEGDPAICTTPDCDLVPRVPTSSWGRKLHPHVPVLYRPVSMSKDFAKALASAEDSRALFRKVNNASQAIELFTNEVPRRPEMIFVENAGRIDENGEFIGRGIIYNSTSTALELQAPQRYRVIGQLRARYAMRLLHETGHHMSRIGVDFVDWPPRPRDK